MWDFLRPTRILDLSRLLPGPYATLLLADLGADVIKIEEPGLGDPLRETPPFILGGCGGGIWSSRFALLNRNKKSVALNLKEAEGREVFLRLVQQSDAVLEAFRPGVAQRLGIDFPSLRAVNPKVVYCSLSGYGQTGPYRERVGHDLNYAGVAGLLSLTGREKPEVPGVPVADLAGGMFAALGLLAALQRRYHTGDGTYIDLSITDAVVSWLTIHFAELFATERVPRSSETILLGAYPCYAIYETADGLHLTVGALEEKFWHNLCASLDRAQHMPYQFDQQKREEILSDFNEIFKTKTRKDWVEFFTTREVPVAPVNSLTEALADEQIRHRQIVRSLLMGGSALQHIAFPAHIQNPAESADRQPPRLGQHTAEVLLALGYPEDAIESLRTRRIIAL